MELWTSHGRKEMLLQTPWRHTTGCWILTLGYLYKAENGNVTLSESDAQKTNQRKYYFYKIWRISLVVSLSSRCRNINFAVWVFMRAIENNFRVRTRQRKFIQRFKNRKRNFNFNTNLEVGKIINTRFNYRGPPPLHRFQRMISYFPLSDCCHCCM